MADGGNRRVQKFDRQGAFLGKWEVTTSGGFGGNPLDVAADAERVWVVEQQGGTLRRYTTQGVLATTGTQDIDVGASASGVALDAGGNLAHSSYGFSHVRHYTRSGDTWMLAATWGSGGTGLGQLSRPLGVAMSPDGGLVYVAERDASRVQRFTSTGAGPLAIGSPGTGDGQLSSPHGVAVDPRNGDVWVADRGNERVQRFSADGAFKEKITTTGGSGVQTFEPVDVAVDGEGHLYVLDIVNRRVIVFKDPPPGTPTPPAGTPKPPSLAIGPPRRLAVGPAVVLAPRKVSAKVLRTSKCVNVRVTARRALQVLVTIYSGRKSLRLFGRRLVRFKRAGKRTVCVPVPKRARTFRPRDGLTLDIRTAFKRRFGLSVTSVKTRRVRIAVAP